MVKEGSSPVVREVDFGRISSLSLLVKVLDAVVDSSAQVTVVNPWVVPQFRSPPHIMDKVSLRGIEQGSFLSTERAEGCKIRLGSELYQSDVYIAPIQNDMIPGLDLLSTYGVTVDLRELVVRIGSKSIPVLLTRCPDGNVVTVSHVVAARKAVLMPNSVQYVMANLTTPCQSHKM